MIKALRTKGVKMKRIIILATILIMGITGCDLVGQGATVSTSGVKKAEATVTTNAAGRTIEQENVIARLSEDNKPGSIKHLYILSAYSGQVIIYSTVRGKITSSGKRLTPYSVAAMDGQAISGGYRGLPVNIGGYKYYTSEVLQDDGTYGSSAEYIYWWDVKGVYHQHFISGGQIVHVSDQPMPVKNIIINLETTK